MQFIKDPYKNGTTYCDDCRKQIGTGMVFHCRAGQCGNGGGLFNRPTTSAQDYCVDCAAKYERREQQIREPSFIDLQPDPNLYVLVWHVLDHARGMTFDNEANGRQTFQQCKDAGNYHCILYDSKLRVLVEAEASSRASNYVFPPKFVAQMKKHAVGLLERKMAEVGDAGPFDNMEPEIDEDAEN